MTSFPFRAETLNARCHPFLHQTHYTSESFITIHVGTDGNGRTLEPQLLAANDRASLNAILDKDFDTDQKLLDYMNSNKTTVGLAVFNATTSIAMPEYLQNAVR